MSELSMDDFDLILPCQSPEGFVSGLAELYGANRLIELEENHNCYSSGLILAFAMAESRDIPLMITPIPMFESCGRLYKAGLPGCSEYTQ